MTARGRESKRKKYSINFNIDGNACDNRNNKARCQHAIIFSAWLSRRRRLMSPFCAVLISCSASQQCNNSHIFAYIFIIFCPLSLFHSLSHIIIISITSRRALYFFLIPSCAFKANNYHNLKANFKCEMHTDRIALCHNSLSFNGFMWFIEHLIMRLWADEKIFQKFSGFCVHPENCIIMTQQRHRDIQWSHKFPICRLPFVTILLLLTPLTHSDCVCFP